MFHTYVYQCFIWILRMFTMVSSVSQVCFVSVLNACFKYFICLYTYVASVASAYFKGVASFSSPSAMSSWCVLLPEPAGIHTTQRPGPSKLKVLPLPPLLARATWAPCGAHETECSHEHPDAGVRLDVPTLVLPF